MQCQQRERKKKNFNEYSYDENNDYIYLGTWVCCDSCGGRKCSGHWYNEHGVDLDEFDGEYVDSVYFNCDLCVQLIIDSNNIQRKCLESFNNEYFGEEGVRSDRNVEESEDNKWVGLSVDVLMECCQDNDWDINEIKVNVLENNDIINEGKKEFIDLFKEYQDKCSNSKFEPSFNHDTFSVTESFALLKKHMIRFIIINIVDYHDDQMTDISDKNLNKLKKPMFFIFLINK